MKLIDFIKSIAVVAIVFSCLREDKEALKIPKDTQRSFNHQLLNALNL